MAHRKNMHYHACYMVGTALVFLVPGLSRAMRNYVAPSGLPALSFYQCLWIPLVMESSCCLSTGETASRGRPMLSS